VFRSIAKEKHSIALEMRWQEPHAPLPVRLIRGPRRPATGSLLTGSPPWIATGAVEQPFDFCGHVRRLLEDIVARTPEFTHIHVPRILVGALQARNSRAHGLQARVTPLRFYQGRLQRRRRETTFQVQRYFLGEHEFLYLMTFCLPRFQDQDFDDKFITLFHELYHVGPEFNGDLRRHQGRCQLHTRSQRHYDKHMAGLARDYLATNPDPALHDFLRLNFAQLEQRHGAVAGIVVPRPKMVPLSAPTLSGKAVGA
jgi:predicted metallopeptidase